MTDQEWYDYGHVHCGIEVGDSVKVLRKVDYEEKGWVCSWVSCMDSAVGRTLIVLENNGRRGFKLPDHYNYPFFVLELIQKKEFEPLLPQNILDIIDNEAMETIKGELELDKERGVIWFNDENGMCRLRVSGLARGVIGQQFIDIKWIRSIPFCRKCRKIEVVNEGDLCIGCMTKKGGGNDESTAKEDNNAPCNKRNV